MLLRKTLFLSLFLLAAVRAQLFDTQPLKFTFDPADGTRSTVSWNPRSFDPSRIRRIQYRETGLRNQATNADGVFRTSVVKQNGPWTDLAEGPQEPTFSYYFIRPNFCDNYEFCIISDRNSQDRPNPNLQFVNGQIEEPCRGITQVMGLPPVRVANETFQRVKQTFYRNGRIQVSLESSPVFDYWKSAIVRVIRANVTAEKCRNLVPNVAQEPFLDPTGTLVTFDPAYVVEECQFRYQVTVDLTIPGQPCSVTYTTPMNVSLLIKLTCDNPEIARHRIAECSEVVATANPNFQSNRCYHCSPNMETEAVLDFDEATRRPVRRIKVNWDFPAFNRPERTPVEYKLRVSKTNLQGSFHLSAREEGTYFDTVPYYLRSTTLDSYTDYRYTTPSYLVQVCAIYQSSCANQIPWESQEKFPIRLKDFETSWLQKEREYEESGVNGVKQYVYRGGASEKAHFGLFGALLGAFLVGYLW